MFMCRRATCKSCQKPSWKGCGAHVEQVLGDVAPDDRCDCSATASSGSGFFATLLGR
jgi:hypothetical protein